MNKDFGYQEQSNGNIIFAGPAACLILLMVTGLQEISIIGMAVEMVLSLGILLVGYLWVRDAPHSRQQLSIFFLGVTPALLVGLARKTAGWLAGDSIDLTYYLFQVIGGLVLLATVYVLWALGVWAKAGRATHSYRTATSSAAGFFLLGALLYGFSLSGFSVKGVVKFAEHPWQIGWSITFFCLAAAISAVGTCFLWLAMRKRGEATWSLIGFIAFIVFAVTHIAQLFSTYWFVAFAIDQAEAGNATSWFDVMNDFLRVFAIFYSGFAVMAFACFGFAFIKTETFPKWAGISLMVLGLLSIYYGLAVYGLVWVMGLGLLIQMYLPPRQTCDDGLGEIGLVQKRP